MQGRIDSSNAAATEKEIEEQIQAHPGKTPVFDASKLEYISSAGLRILMKVRKAAGARTEIREVSPEIYEILEMTGFTDLMRVSKRMREVSVEGCEVIGHGFYGTVYRIDPDTIVKVYSSPEYLTLIENERKMSRMAFVKGIPTAISYDIVKVGDSYGSVFELLKSQTMNDWLLAEPERADEITREFVGLMKKVHAVSLNPGELPSAREKWLRYVEKIHQLGHITDPQAVRLTELLTAVPESGTVIHGDLHMKNIMMADGEPVLIDMDTLAQGDPVFDLQAVYVTYKEFEEDRPGDTQSFLGIDADTADRIWRKTLEYYFETQDPEILERMSEKIRLVAAVRFLEIVTKPDREEDPVETRRVLHTREHIAQLLETVDSLTWQ